MTLKAKCTVEPTKNPKWARLTPTERCAIAPFVVRASELPQGARTVTVTVGA